MSATVTMSAVAAKAGARLSSRAISKQVRTPTSARPRPNFIHSHVDNPLFPLEPQARALAATPRVAAKPRASLAAKAMLVTIEHEGKTYEVECDGHDNILDAALDAGIENLSYDCKMGGA